jgi:hypothetical protein
MLEGRRVVRLGTEDDLLRPGRPAPLGQAVYPAQKGRGADLRLDLREPGAMIRSQASASSRPAAKHIPWTAAITGNGASSSVLISWNPSANISRACPAVVPAKRWTSAPPQNSGPSACRTRARASSLTARWMAPSSPALSSMVKVLAGGLAIVTTATSPDFSYFVSIMMLRSAGPAG